MTSATPTSTSPGGQPVAGGKRLVDKKTRRRIIIASTVGTTIEFYDFYAYATAAVAVFPFLFFPKNENPTVSLLASFATFGLAFVARPLGSVVFGHFGDRAGRKVTLVASLLTMGIATFIIGLLPTYASIGIAAPALLALMRFCQGLGLGGEWSGAALLATENAEPGARARAAMWPQLGAPFGFILANGLFLILVLFMGHENGQRDGAFMEWGWRIPFLLSAVMVIVGLYVRFKLEETPVFKAAVESGKKADSPLGEVFKTAWRPMILGTAVMLSTYTLFYLVTTWVLSYGIANPAKSAGLGIPYVTFLKMQLVTILFFAAAVPLAGRWADQIGRKRFLGIVSVLMLVFAATFAVFLTQGSATIATVTVWLAIGMFLMGLIFGPMSAVLPEMFPTNVRYTGSGIAYNVSSILGAAVAPFIATALVNAYGVGSVGLYLAVVTGITLIAIFRMTETKDIDLHHV
ncbi:MFS transporter [Corynebacterium falsenii]|uniref:Putative proline/betaine transporter n=1 Tax=Corynebacterium falsenii TaxID=108486 RepID=A0A418Q7X6_9CORY|nr:MFS transporter [Corynebacterium falsenii]AHI03071.1 major facilitator transporter [Corynebacterium falsenii DSM 44353]MDC7104556.1 MFS transporter [Corynebacterium falsenii]RIX35604.1 MFS transporter [Corynebacterium falsenii]UBI03781.1 MHS family MFS transporter [Corynebacterium falsenii]UBI06209.1 MHS family MFS transporter [Corynebacterium falsenii]